METQPSGQVFSSQLVPDRGGQSPRVRTPRLPIYMGAEQGEGCNRQLPIQRVVPPDRGEPRAHPGLGEVRQTGEQA